MRGRSNFALSSSHTIFSLGSGSASGGQGSAFNGASAASKISRVDSENL
jgi:hypothetical protein